MKLKKLIAAGAIAGSVGLSGAASAATVDFTVDAKANSITGGDVTRGLDTVSLVAGQMFSIAADILDTWSLGNRASLVSTAEGLTSKSYTFLGATFDHGTLVGRVGDGAFFRVGTSVALAADVSGVLRLFMWDKNNWDNSGDIVASVSTSDIVPVPLPAGAPLLLAGVAGLALLRRRKA
jgi:hypothetical protein